MKSFVKAFVLRGLIVAGFGPVILAIIYAILGKLDVIEMLSVTEVVKGILTITLMVFIAAGITAIYQIERLPVFFAALIHGVALYIDYLMIYLVNGWIANGTLPIIIFSSIFVAGYLVVWLIIYLVTRHDTKKLNEKISA